MIGSIMVSPTFGHFQWICGLSNRARREVQTASIPLKFLGYVALTWHYANFKQFFQRVSHKKVLGCQSRWHGPSKNPLILVLCKTTIGNSLQMETWKKSFNACKNYFFRQHVSRDNFSPATRCAYLERTKIKFSSRKMLSKVRRGRWGLPSLRALYKITIGNSLQMETSKKILQPIQKIFFQKVLLACF